MKTMLSLLLALSLFAVTFGDWDEDVQNCIAKLDEELQNLQKATTNPSSAEMAAYAAVEAKKNAVSQAFNAVERWRMDVKRKREQLEQDDLPEDLKSVLRSEIEMLNAMYENWQNEIAKFGGKMELPKLASYEKKRDGPKSDVSQSAPSMMIAAFVVIVLLMN